MYFEESDIKEKVEPVSKELTYAVSFVAILLFVFGLLPSSLIDLTYNSL